MKTRTVRVGMTIVAALAVVCLLWTMHTGAFPGSRAFGQAVGNDDHGKAKKPGGHDDDDHGKAEEPGGHEGHDEHDEEGPVVEMTAAQMETFGITLATAGPGEIRKEVRLPGEIVINADRSAHVVPSASGIVRKVTASVGDTVAVGDVLALIESAALAEARSDYLTKLNEQSCRNMDLARARAIHGNTAKLLKMLDSGPSLDELTRLDSAAMGENRASLVSAYAELVFTRDAYAREKKLAVDNLTSKSDLETAAAAYKKAHAIYIATRDSTSYATAKALLEAQRSRDNQELAVKAAERKLTILGQAPQAASTKCKADCTDPNCKECKAKGAAGAAGADDLSLDGKLGWYALRVPFDGTVIAKHIVVGEKLTDDADVYTIADMRTVWVDLDIYQKDLASIGRGQSVEIHFGSGIGDAEGTVAYVSPIVDARTRTGLARIVLPNPKGRYRPGLFVTAHVEVARYTVPVLVPGGAVQTIDGKSYVFVPTDEGLMGEAVTRGRSSRTHVEILEGLHVGEKYVAKGAFKLSSKIALTGLGAHAGHGH